MKLTTATALMLAVAIQVSPALATDSDDAPPPPANLTIGYYGEGKIDASPRACAEDVGERASAAEDAKEVCAARRAHIAAYAAIQKSYHHLMKTMDGDGHPANAAKAMETMVNACIDHKEWLDEAHGPAVDILANQNAAKCLELGKRLMDEESASVVAGGAP